MSNSRLRAANDTRGFEERKVSIFDDSFEHEAWHDGDSTRVNLIVDFWHPDLSDADSWILMKDYYRSCFNEIS